MTASLIANAAIAEERIALWMKEAAPLFERHWQEVGRNRERIVLAPDWQRIVAMDMAGAIAGYTVRQAGVLVGYCGFLLGTGLHYRNNRFAFCDVIYVAPECRGSTGVRLVRFCEKSLRAKRVDKVSYHIKDSTPRMVQLLERMGYERTEINLEKVL